jgi:hypothetical protein
MSKELMSGSTFDGWKEGLINFPPTYKYERNSSRYVGEVPKEAGKKRSPAWLSLFSDYTVFIGTYVHIPWAHCVLLNMIYSSHLAFGK